jgi:hypothetical protein
LFYFVLLNKYINESREPSSICKTLYYVCKGLWFELGHFTYPPYGIWVKFLVTRLHDKKKYKNEILHLKRINRLKECFLFVQKRKYIL